VRLENGKGGASIAAFRFRKLSFEPEAHQPLAELLSLATEKEEGAKRSSN
jgi:hypothetical protein